MNHGFRVAQVDDVTTWWAGQSSMRKVPLKGPGYGRRAAPLRNPRRYPNSAKPVRATRSLSASGPGAGEIACSSKGPEFNSRQPYCGSQPSGMRESMVASIMYTIVVPMINPFIYSLRNRDIKKALQKTVKII
ncbi:uncharacterized protein LOC142846352 isoform X2 [Microtus pennsylvanicus]|uniref:uncharacterized protein LOC142846352 isoform X2 n=1 Tax=Microtus pennsylvanicus TaxID=10058 RepID=UPI003F6D2A86